MRAPELSQGFDEQIKEMLGAEAHDHLAIAKNPDSEDEETDYVLLHLPEGREGIGFVRLETGSYERMENVLFDLQKGLVYIPPQPLKLRWFYVCAILHIQCADARPSST